MKGAQQIGGPGKAAFTQPAFGKVLRPCLRQQATDQLVVVGARGGRNGERNRAEAELEQPVAGARLQIVVALGGGFGDQPDLRLVEPKAAIGLRLGRLERARIGQEDAGRAGFDDGGRDRAFRDVGERLGGEDDRDILLAQCFEPFADAGGKQRVIPKRSRPRLGSAALAGRRSALPGGGTGT